MQIQVHPMQIVPAHWFAVVVLEVGSRIYCAACQAYQPSVDVSKQLSTLSTPSRCRDSCQVQRVMSRIQVTFEWADPDKLIQEDWHLVESYSVK